MYGDDDSVRQFLYMIKKFGYRYCTVPLEIGDSFFGGDDVRRVVGQVQSIFKDVYPDLYECLLELPNLIADIESEVDNPLLQKLIELLQDEIVKKTAVVLKDRFAINKVDGLIKTLVKGVTIEVFGEAELNDRGIFDRMIFLGASRWYPDHAFDAPRCRIAEILALDWINDTWTRRVEFISPIVNISSQYDDTVEHNYEPIHYKELLPAEDVPPQIDWRIISSGFLSKPSKDIKSSSVNALLVSLEGDSYAFLENEEHSKILTLDINNYGNNEILKKIFVSGLKQGMFVVLRTEGGSDLLVPVADQILGNLAESYRASQYEWKSAFRERISSHGIQEISRELKLYGSNHASTNNIRNWASKLSIRTQQYENFLAIIKVIGRAEKANDYWEVARKIDRAHRAAGMFLRKLLLKQIQLFNLEELEVSGRMDFVLTSAGGGKLTAFRITGISPDEFTILENRIGQVFEEEKYIWPE